MNTEEHEKLLKKILNKSIPKTGYYDRLGNPIDIGTWTKLLAEPEYRIIAREFLEGVTISTSWFGCETLRYSNVIFIGEDITSHKQEILAHCTHDTEDEALWIHAQLIFLFDQKLWRVGEDV